MSQPARSLSQPLTGVFTRYSLARKAAYVLAVTALIYAFTSHWIYDDPFITYRYAQNILSGVGFVYNAGEPVLSTTTPLFALLLAPLGLFNANLARWAQIIGAGSLALGALALYDLARAYRTPIIGAAALLLYPIFSLLLQTLSSETPLYLALILWSFAFYERRQYTLVGLLCALASLTRPDGILAPALLAAHFLFLRLKEEKIPWRAVAIFAVLILAWVAFAQAYFGSPLPVTLTAKQRQGSMTISQTFLPGLFTILRGYLTLPGYWVYFGVALVGLAGLAWLPEGKPRGWLLLLAWTAAYFAGYSILRVSRYFWYYAPLIPALVILAGSGASAIAWGVGKVLRSRPRAAAVAAALVLLILLAVEAHNLWLFKSFTDTRIPVYRQAGEWLAANSASGDRVGALEVGALGYYAQRRMVDFAGLIQPDVAAQLNPQTTYEDAAIYAVNRYQPEWVVMIQDAFPRLRSEWVGMNCSAAKEFAGEGFGVEIWRCR